MSVLTGANQDASSSRVRAVFRFLLSTTNQSEDRERLENLLSPPPLRTGGDAGATARMIHGTIGEAISMGLLLEDGGKVAINPALNTKDRHERTGDKRLPSTIAALMFASNREANHDLADMVAWYLAQDPYAPPGNWSETETRLRDQGAAGQLDMMNDARYSQFKDWVCFLGFAWRHDLAGREQLTPDPTAYLRREVGTLFGDDEALAIGDFTSRLSTHCPVFEAGAFRDKVEAMIGHRASAQHLSATTALALLRLDDEKEVNLTKHSDAPVFLFPVIGEPPIEYSHIARVKRKARGGVS